MDWLTSFLVLVTIGVSADLVPRKPSPVENPDLYEGDIELPPKTDGFRSAVVKQRLWPDGVVPYVFSEKSNFTPEQKRNLTVAMNIFHDNSCVRWVPRTTELYYIRFQGGSGCSSQVGRLVLSSGPLKNGQPISFGEWCFQSIGTLVHEMMHTLGFFHEQSRLDRDDHVHIDSRWIRQGLLGQFRKHDEQSVNKELNAPYDYNSVMHYSREAFSSYEGKETIIPRVKGAVIGQRNGLSEIDKWKLNKLYECSEYESVTLAPELYTTPAKVALPTTEPTKVEDRIYCNFDFEWTCDFHDDMKSDLDWVLGQGKADKYGNGDTGPLADRDGKECCYMHLASTAWEPKQKAYFISPFLDITTGHCLEFSYHMLGRDIGSLRVYTKNFKGEIGKVLFEAHGDQGKDWKDFKTKVKSYEPFELVFEATLGGERYAFNSDIALDSIMYRPLDKMTTSKREACLANN